MQKPTIRDNAVISWSKRLLISLNLCAISMSQKVILGKPQKDIYHRVEVGVRHSVREGEAPKHNIRVFGIVDVYVAACGSIQSHGSCCRGLGSKPRNISSVGVVVN